MPITLWRSGKNFLLTIWDYVNDAKLKELIADLDETDLFLILHSKSTGAWLNVRDTTVTGIVLAATEFIDI